MRFTLFCAHSFIHVMPQRLAKEFTHRAMFARRKLLRLFQQIRWQCNTDRLSYSHDHIVKYCSTMSTIIRSLQIPAQ